MSLPTAACTYTAAAASTGKMRKRIIEVDETQVAHAAAVLGTRGLEATVHRALEEVVAAKARRRLALRLMAMDGLDLDQPAVMAAAWR